MKKFGSLHLPQTSFPLRPNNERFKQDKVIDRITTLAYRKQQPSNTLNKFHLLDGPPFANGQLHMGHFLNKVLKDMFNRFQLTFRGKHISYTPGWDCHGLPIELLVKRSSSSSLEEIRTKSRQVAEKAIALQAKDFRSWGVFADWDTKYTTMDAKFEAKEMQLFGQLFAKGMISRRLKPVYWSPKSQTALAEAELEYKDNHQSFSIFAKFQVLDDDANKNKRYLVAWTTTPWSLTGNMALAVNKDAEYVQCKQENGDVLIIAKNRVEALQQHLGHDVVFLGKTLHSKDLCSLQCLSPYTKNRVPVITSDHVTLDSGTGVVHIAPLHGMEDFDCFTAAFPEHKFTEDQLTVDRRGRFKPALFPDMPDAMTTGSELIYTQLERDNLLVGAVKPIKHRYPIDWRTKTPIMIMATNQFFLQLSPQAAQQVCSEKIRFVPESGKNRLVNTIGSRKEWCLSRQRVWGLPIPYYQHKHNANEIYITTELIQRFSELCEAKGSDFWFQQNNAAEEDDAKLLPAEELAKECWQRGTDTLDVWFDSGSVWNSSSTITTTHQADLVVEGSDQHRGWFQSSVLLKTAASAEAEPPFKAIVTHGFVLDDKKQKMSKSLGNIISPQDAIQRFNGNVDVLRLWVAGADVTSDVLMSQESLDRAADKMKKIRHLWRFFLSLGKPMVQQSNVELDVLDKAMLFALWQTKQAYLEQMDAFQCRLGVSEVMDFLHGDCLKAYVETRKDVLYCDKLGDVKRQAALVVFQQILEQTVGMLAPVCVFTADEVMHEHGVVSAPAASEVDWQAYEPEFQAFSRLLRLRHELNQLNVPDEVRMRSDLHVTLTDEEGYEHLSRFLLQAHDREHEQWSNAADLLQVFSVTLHRGDRFSIDLRANAKCTQKCDRCRKMHPSTKQQHDNTCWLCDRCAHCEATAGKQ